jgi:hypothetical protein
MRFASPRLLRQIVCLFVSLPLYAYAQSLHFTREVITVALGDSSAIVLGRYWFENSGAIPVRQAVFYPFAADSLMIDSVSVSGECCGARWCRTINGLSIPMDILPRSTAIVTVRYRESTPGRFLRYILTSTASWGEPLRKARYDVCLPRGLVLDTLSPGPAVRTAVAGGTLYRIERSMFLPDQDLIVRWARRK